MLRKIFREEKKSKILKLVAFLIGAMALGSSAIIANFILEGELINRNLWPTIQIILSMSLLPILVILIFHLTKKFKKA